MRGRRLAATTLALVLSGIVGDAASAATIGRVAMRDNFFAPRRLVVEKGSRVRWANRGANPHTTTSVTGLWDSGTLSPGHRFRRRFGKVGKFRYRCEIHPDEMRGKIVVVA